MKTTRKILAVSVAVFLASSGLSAAPLADKLPDQTLFYLGWAGRSLTFDGSLMGQMLKEPEIGTILGAVREAISTGMGREDEQLRGAFEQLWAMGAIAWRHPAAIGLFDLSVERRAGPGAAPAGGAPEPRPVGALLIDLGKDRAAFADHLQKLLAVAGKKLKVTRATVGDVSYQSFPTPAGPCGLGFVGDFFFASMGEKAPETIVALIGGKAASLAANPNFVAAMKEVAGEQVQAAYYVDVARAFALVDRMVAAEAPATAPAGPSQFRQVIDALGVGGVTAIVGATNIVDRGMYEKTRVLSPGPHRGLLMLPTGEPLSAEALKRVPADADVVVAVSLDPAAVLAEVKRVAGEIEPQAAQQIDEALGMVSKELGLDIEKELIAHMGNEWMLLSAPSLGGFLTGTALSVELKDPVKFAAGLGKVETFFKQMLGQEAGEADPPGRRGRGVEIRSCKSEKLEIHYLAMPGLPVPVAPSWAIADGRLYIAAFPQVITAAANGTTEKPLSEMPAFAALRKRLAATPSAMMYVNTPALARRLYGLPMGGWSLLCNMAGGELGPVFSPQMLPALSKVEKYLLPEISTVSFDDKGITLESFGSGASAGMMIGATPMQVAFLLPALARARGKAKEAISMHNLMTIGKGCAIYATEHQQFPADLTKLIDAGYLPVNVLVSPLSGRAVQRDAQGKVVGPFDYVYLVGGLRPDQVKDPARTIMAYERPELYRFRGTNVLYVDCHASWVAMPTFQQQLKQTQKLLETLSKGGE